MHKKSLEAAVHLENGEIDKESTEDDTSVGNCSPVTTGNTASDKLCMYQYNLQFVHSDRQQ